MKTTALTHFIGIVPFGQQHTTWYCIGFGKSGHWQSYSVHLTEADAKRQRARLYRVHRELAAERAARRRK